MKWGKLGVALAASMLVMAAAAWAGEATTEYEWSAELDCSICHEKEWKSVQASDGTAAAQDAQAQEAAKTDNSDAGQKDTAAQDSTKSADKAEAQKDAEAADSQESTRELYASMHVQSFGFTCITCHVDNEDLAEGHKKLNSGKEAKRLKKSSVESEICTACHDTKTLAEATKDLDVLTDTNGTVVNPHDLPVNDSHDGIECVSCHKAHSGAEKPLAETAYNTCISCHHEGVFECGTCHS